MRSTVSMAVAHYCTPTVLLSHFCYLHKPGPSWQAPPSAVALTGCSRWAPCRRPWWRHTPACAPPRPGAGTCGCSTAQICTGHSGAAWAAAGSSCDIHVQPCWSQEREREEGGLPVICCRGEEPIKWPVGWHPSNSPVTSPLRTSLYRG